jgi:hypothetical protein
MVLAATHDATGWATAKSLDHYTRCALLSERVVSGACLREIGMPVLLRGFHHRRAGVVDGQRRDLFSRRSMGEAAAAIVVNCTTRTRRHAAQSQVPAYERHR